MKNSNHGDVYQHIVDLRNSGGEAVLVTVIKCSGSTPRKAGAKMLVYANGSIQGTVGGGIREADIIAMAQELLVTGNETLLTSVDFNEGLKGEGGPVCGGVMEIFMERIRSKRALVIGGAGHIGLCLYHSALQLDYRVIVIDPRPELNNEDRYPQATRLVREFDRGVEDIELTENDAVVLVGPGHVADQQVLPSVLKSKAGYIGMIGSKRKKAEVYATMKENLGFTEAELARIYSPVGLNIGSESPAEIAVAIIAEIIKHFNVSKAD